MFLTSEQLEDLTGHKQPAAQIRWLLKNDIEHYVRADGRPRVPNPIRKNSAATKPVPVPRFEALAARH